MKTTRIILVLIALVIAIPFIGRLFWAMQESKQLDLLIVNKTVPKPSRNEVKSLNWVLNSSKIVKTNNTCYNYSRDYFGYYPDASSEEWRIRYFRLEDISQLHEKYDGLIFIDNQGVEMDPEGVENRMEYYGGLNQNDYLLLKNMIRDHKLIVIECNFLSNNTEELVQYNAEQLMDIFNIGWKGKYFANLSSHKVSEEIGEEWLEKYKKYQQKSWNFKGPGLIFLNDKQDRIIVLPSDEYMNSHYPEIISDDIFVKEMNLPERVAYTGWFDVVYPGKNTVISSFDMNLNDKGVELLKKNGLDAVFPATIKADNCPLYYIAGDFSKHRVFLASSRMMLINTLLTDVCRKMSGKPQFFFQAYYVPFLESVFGEYYTEKNQI